MFVKQSSFMLNGVLNTPLYLYTCKEDDAKIFEKELEECRKLPPWDPNFTVK